MQNYSWYKNDDFVEKIDDLIEKAQQNRRAYGTHTKAQKW